MEKKYLKRGKGRSIFDFEYVFVVYRDMQYDTKRAKSVQQAKIDDLQVSIDMGGLHLWSHDGAEYVGQIMDNEGEVLFVRPADGGKFFVVGCKDWGKYSVMPRTHQ